MVMEIQPIVIDAKIICALKLFAAKDDVRKFLNGINLEIGRHESRLVATNGRMLGCFRIRSDQPLVHTPIRDIVIPNEMLKSIKPAGTVEISIGDIVKDTSSARPVTLRHAAGGEINSGVTLDEGHYPDYRRVVPKHVSGEPAHFDARLIGKLAEAWSILHGKKTAACVGIGFNGRGGALVDLCHDDFVGVVMPLRETSITRSIFPKAPPDWLDDMLNDIKPLIAA